MKKQGWTFRKNRFACILKFHRVNEKNCFPWKTWIIFIPGPWICYSQDSYGERYDIHQTLMAKYMTFMRILWGKIWHSWDSYGERYDIHEALMGKDIIFTRLSWGKISHLCNSSRQRYDIHEALMGKNMTFMRLLCGKIWPSEDSYGQR